MPGGGGAPPRRPRLVPPPAGPGPGPGGGPAAWAVGGGAGRLGEAAALPSWRAGVVSRARGGWEAGPGGGTRGGGGRVGVPLLPGRRLFPAAAAVPGRGSWRRGGGALSPVPARAGSGPSSGPPRPASPTPGRGRAAGLAGGSGVGTRGRASPVAGPSAWRSPRCPCRPGARCRPGGVCRRPSLPPWLAPWP